MESDLRRNSVLSQTGNLQSRCGLQLSVSCGLFLCTLMHVFVVHFYDSVMYSSVVTWLYTGWEE